MLTEKQKYHDHNDQKMKSFYSIPWLELFLVGSLFTKYSVQDDLCHLMSTLNLIKVASCPCQKHNGHNIKSIISI